MRIYSLKTFAGLTLVCIAVGIGVAEFAYVGLDSLYPYAFTSSGEKGSLGVGFNKPYGKLTFTAFAVSPGEIGLTLSFMNYEANSYYNLTVWIGDINAESGRYGMLPEGFELVRGDLTWNGSGATPEVNLQAGVKAVKDGEWKLAGFALWYASGSSQRQSSGTLEIIVSGGRVTDIRKYEPGPQASPRIKLQTSGFSDIHGICVSLIVNLENMTIKVTNGVAANHPPNQTVFFNDTMCGLRIDKSGSNGWQTYMTFGEPGMRSLEPWESENVTVSLDVFTEKGLYCAISEGWFEQDGQRVLLWAKALFEVLYGLEQ